MSNPTFRALGQALAPLAKALGFSPTTPAPPPAEEALAAQRAEIAALRAAIAAGDLSTPIPAAPSTRTATAATVPTMSATQLAESASQRHELAEITEQRAALAAQQEERVQLHDVVARGAAAARKPGIERTHADVHAMAAARPAKVSLANRDRLREKYPGAYAHLDRKGAA